MHYLTSCRQIGTPTICIKWGIIGYKFTKQCQKKEMWDLQYHRSVVTRTKCYHEGSTAPCNLKRRQKFESLTSDWFKESRRTLRSNPASMIALTVRYHTDENTSLTYKGSSLIGTLNRPDDSQIRRSYSDFDILRKYCKWHSAVHWGSDL